MILLIILVSLRPRRERLRVARQPDPAAAAAGRRGDPPGRRGEPLDPPRGAGALRLPLPRRGREGGPLHLQRPLRRERDLRPGLSPPPRRSRQPGLRGRPPRAALGHDHGGGGPAPRRALGGGRADHARHRAAHLLQPQRPLAGSGLEVPAGVAPWASHWRSSAPSSWRSPGPDRAGRSRCSSTTSSAPAPSSPGPGCAPPSSSSWSATARRWGSRRSTPGSPTPTGRPPACSGRCWPAGSPTSPSSRWSASSR